ncbi:MFS transporter [Sphaerisporangium fuscum]|uniref:MFS transporter n=1 Tax=Sphaerisporangium fuscum TaxID=2835868 RepID=UPI001BDCF573|nr:MFS transporter [Sphaerisporangium fuscum]
MVSRRETEERDISAPQGEPPPRLSRTQILVLAVACGITAANIYFPQAISPLIAADLHVAPDSAALAVTATQLGYAAGLFLLVPLGDRVPHKRLILTLLTLTGLGLLAVSAAPTLPLLIAASTLVGATTVVPQVIVPMAAGLVPDERRGAVVGTLMGGLIAGILLARTFGATVGEWLGWHAPYQVATVLVLLLGVALAFTLPTTAPASREPYPALLAAPLRLLMTEPELRRSCLYQAALFAGFNAAWTSLALLVTGPVYGLGAQAVGLIAFAGAGSLLCTPIAGRWVDRLGADLVNLVCILCAVVAAVVLSAGSLGGVAGMVALLVGMLLIDTAVQGGQVANQARIFAIDAAARGRLNTGYMTCSFLGGSFGSWIGVRTYTHLSWLGVCALVAVAAVIALARHLLRRAPATVAVRR